jgi:magnesium chelatase accessory protein
MSPSETTFVRCAGMRWRVLRDGRGPVVLALHGTGSSADSFLGLTAALSHHFMVVSPDLPGHGQSRPDGRADLSLNGMASAVERLTRELRLEAQIVIGHSAGAAVIARLLLDHRIAPDLFVGIAPAILPLPTARHTLSSAAARVLGRSRRLRRFAMRQSEARVEGLVRGMGSTLGPEALDHYRRLAGSPEHVEGVLEMLSTWDVAPVYRALERITVRSLLVAGARDEAIPVAHAVRVAERLRRGRLVVVPGAGHLVHEEKPAEVARLVLDDWHACAQFVAPMVFG